MDLLQVNKNGQPGESGASTCRFIEKQLSSERKNRRMMLINVSLSKYFRIEALACRGSVDDEYDFDGASRKKHKRKKDMLQDKAAIPKRLLTQKERCQFCFENPSRPKHLVISIANFTYMMVPPWEPVVQGHCCILHYRNVWEEIRNFKKCLLKMFSRKDKDVIFLETVVELSGNNAIDEAEDEWGQHDMKKVIQTSGNLRNVIPENLSYFHVEFGLDRGFVHIDDDDNFPSSFGPNVIRGMLRLPEEDMHRPRKHESTEKQKQAVAALVQEWKPFDWTKDLD
ncbi:hypothetical protein HPP92_017791 [Vanilla planifolia]|uniref:CWF19-like protein 2 n=1 Tax=Vanilla planifolia TaxID=51239 RepID=A0A835QBR7_VANPL|nr:hypothetical protein HPP92_017791 [Vanilla planifolia]